MRNLKRALCLALASVMVLGMTVIGASAATASDFTDYDSVEEKEAIDVMAAIDVIEGTESGAFNPEGHFTREQAAKILSVMLLGSGNADKLNNNAQIFKDVAAGKWSAGYIAYCSNVGIIAGDGQGNFNPEGELDAVSFGKMLLVALGYNPAKEGYINSPAWQQSISGDMIEAGIDVEDVKFDDILTREQATVMAFKAIQTPLVEYANYLDPSKATYVTTTIAKEQTISEQTLSNTSGNPVYTIEFGEKYQPSLVRSDDDTEEFCRGAHKWTNGNVKIGRYNNTPDLVYTTEVTNGQIYSDLKLSETILVGTDPTDSQYFIDGRAVFYDPTASDEIFGTGSNYTDVLELKSKDDVKLGGNGTLTEVYFNDISYNDDGTKTPAWAKIVSVNTYVGDVTSKAENTSKHDAYITITPRIEEGTTVGPLTPPVTTANYDTEDFALEDIVLFTYSFKQAGNDVEGVQSVQVADVVTGQLTAYTTNVRVAIDDESYSYSKKVANEAKAKDLKFDVDIVLDEYGYAIDVDPVGLNTGYAVILNSAIGDNTGSGDFNDTDAVQLLLTDGSIVDKALLTNGHTNEYDVGDIVQYTINNRDKYTLKLVAKVNTNTQTTKVNNKYSVEVENGAYSITDIVDQKGTIKAGGNTIFLVRDLDGNKDSVYTAYYGIKNVPDIRTGAGKTTDATVYSDGGVAVIVYIDATDIDTTINTSDDDYVFVKKDDTKLTQDTERGDYYHYEAIVDGEITEIDVDDDTVNGMTESTLYKNVRIDDYDIYSLEDQAARGVGVKKVENDVLAIETGTTGSYEAYVASDDCAVFYVDENEAINQISVPAVTDDNNDIVWYITNTNDLLTCVVIIATP